MAFIIALERRDTMKKKLCSLSVLMLSFVLSFSLVGSYVNLEYPLPSGIKAKFLNDQTTYLGTQLESDKFCYGVLANVDFILICTYEEEGNNPNLLLFKKR